MEKVGKPDKFNAAAIVLAAGTSSRYGDKNKLAAVYRGVPLLDHTLRLISELPFRDRILVTGHDCENIEILAKQYPVRISHNPGFTAGMGSSIATGVHNLGEGCDAAMIFLADMPDIPAELVRRVFHKYAQTRSNVTIARPMFDNQAGHPVLFASAHFEALSMLTGDQGARNIVKNNEPDLLYIRAQTRACIRDMDRPDPPI